MTCSNAVTALQATTFEVTALTCCDDTTVVDFPVQFVAENFVTTEISVTRTNVSPYPPDDTDDPPTVGMYVPENFVAYPNDLTPLVMVSDAIPDVIPRTENPSDPTNPSSHPAPPGGGVGWW